ncbi:hypothetical protein [Abyssibacter sp.]|jgi:hypothetical protein|uniref:hypothetical protein n=1 Tax=Abyssibacter sp. TaxID=2320200 RepID=UPI0025BB4530|nr:hypothetical protein [Abyssibacter sp.]MCK5859786.1 hypothetical protein [Abyssibacter sp.]
MTARLTMMTTVFADGGRMTRFGDFVVCRLSTGSFTVTSLEFQPIRMWAHAKLSTGNVVRDRALFVDRFQTLLARKGSGIATRGNREALKRLARGLQQMGIAMGEWSVPHDLNACDMPPRRRPAVEPSA